MKIKKALLFALILPALTFHGYSSDIAGTWDVQGTKPDGGIQDSLLIITENDGKFAAVASSDRGEMELDSVVPDGNRLTIEKRFEAGGNSGTLKIEATLQASGKLSGTWSLAREGAETINGAWNATKRKVEIDVTGEWKTTVTYKEETREYGLLLKNSDDGKSLTGHALGENGVEMPCKSVTFNNDCLVVTMGTEYEGEDIDIRYEAKLNKSGQFTGEFYAVGYKERFNGSWTADKK